MSIRYCRKFFETLEDGETFKKDHGGVLYDRKKKIKRGSGPHPFDIEAVLDGLTVAQREKYRCCVAWNERT